jgi:hypothetical protein
MARAKFLVVLMLIVLSGAGAFVLAADGDEEEVVPQGIITPPPESVLSIEIWTDHKIYSPKEPLRIHLKLSRDAYVYVYNIDPEGKVKLLFPNGFSRQNFLKAGKYTLPDRPTYSFVVTELGVETLQAIALLKPLPLLSLSAQGLDEVPFPKLSDDPQALKPQVEGLIEVTVEPGEWAADWTQFVVAPAVAYLRITSQPQGARVYIDGELRGLSPLELKLEPGEVHVALVKEGYRRWSKSLTLENRDYRELSVRLLPASPLFIPRVPDDEIEGFIAPLALGLNVGLNPQGIFSLGLELGFSWRLGIGGSLSFTQDEVPEYFDLGGPVRFERERVYDLGPESELYVKLSLLILEGLYLHGGGGVSVQERVHIAAPPGVIVVSGFKPLVEILPNGYRETVSYLTAFGGVSFRVGESFLSLSYHTRRGWVLGLTLSF